MYIKFTHIDGLFDIEYIRKIKDDIIYYTIIQTQRDKENIIIKGSVHKSFYINKKGILWPNVKILEHYNTPLGKILYK